MRDGKNDKREKSKRVQEKAYEISAPHALGLETGHEALRGHQETGDYDWIAHQQLLYIILASNTSSANLQGSTARGDTHRHFGNDD